MIVMSCGWLSRSPARGDPDEAGVLQVVDRRGSAVPHRLAQPSDELVDDRLHRALVRNAPLDPLGHELVDVLDVALEVPVLREASRLHRAERAHAAVLLHALAVDEHDVAGSLVRAREQRAGHDRVRAGRDRLRDVAGGGQPAVRDHRHAVLGGHAGALVDGRDLRDADACDDPRRADRSRANADLHRVGAGVDQRLGRLRRGDVAHDELGAVEAALQLAGHRDAPRSSGRAPCRARARPRPRRRAPRRDRARRARRRLRPPREAAPGRPSSRAGTRCASRCP